MVRSLRLTPRQWRIYLAVWLAAATLLGGWLLGQLALRLGAPPAPRELAGGLVIRPAVAAPDFQLQDQAGRPVSPASLRGRVVALTFLDTQCQNLCPLQAAVLGRAQADLGPKPGLTVVVISVRPGADTPATIAGFAASHGLAGDLRWLNGSPAQLQRAWSDYGVGVQVASGDLEHSSIIYLIDRRGYERIGFPDVPDLTQLEQDVRLLQGS